MAQECGLSDTTYTINLLDRLMLQTLLLVLVLPALVLVGLTVLISSGRLGFSSRALTLLAQQREIWMLGIIAIVTAGAIKALMR